MSSNVLINGLAAWLIPGLGHILLGRWFRGLIISVSILLMLIIGWALRGAYLFETGADQGLMHFFHQVSVLGNAPVFLFHFITGGSATTAQIQEAVKSSTFEYGVRFLAVAGLLNYLSVLDAVDISLGRKE